MGRQVVTSLEVASSLPERGSTGAPSPMASPLGDPMGAAVGAGGAAPAVADDYRTRLVKYIPTEIIALYVTAVGLIAKQESTTGDETVVSWIVFLVLMGLTPVYLFRMEGVEKKQQLAISTVCFFVWVFATTDGPFADFLWYSPLYGVLGMILFTFCVPLFEAKA